MRDRPLPRPAVVAAIRLLESASQTSKLMVEFSGLVYAVEIAEHFLFDSGIGNDLLRDDTATSDGERFTYATSPGTYLGQKAESPVGFLLDRFGHASDQAGDADMQFVGLWQMLQLV